MAKFTQRLGSLFKGKRSQGDPVHPVEEAAPVDTPDDRHQGENEGPAKFSRTERDTAIAHIQTTQNQLVERVGELADKQSENTERLDQVTRTLGDLPQVEKAITEHAHQLETLGRQVDASVGTTRRLHDEVSSVHQAVDEVKTAGAAQAETIRRLSEQIAELDERLAALLDQRKRSMRAITLVGVVTLVVVMLIAIMAGMILLGRP